MNDLIEKYKNHIENSIFKAEKNESLINNEILNLDGMSGVKTRHFYNNLLNIDDARYLEIGLWKGSSLCSAMYKNKTDIICIDNFNEGKHIKETFLYNLNNFKGDNNVLFINEDCFTVDISKINKRNIYLYDGGHSYEDHYKALSYFYDCLDDIFIFIVDDWNNDTIRDSTLAVINDLKLKKLYEKEIRLTFDNTHTPYDIAKIDWWNGIYITLLMK